MCNPAWGTGYFWNSKFVCESTDCKTSCPNGDGKFSTTMQMCQWTNDPQSASSACGTSCQSVASSFYYDSSTSKYWWDFKCTIGGVSQIGKFILIII